MSAAARVLACALLVFFCSCATGGDVAAPGTARVEAQPESVVISSGDHSPQVQVSDEEFQAAMKLLLPSLWLPARPPPYRPFAIPASWAQPEQAMRELLAEYDGWCRARHESFDCLQLLTDGRTTLGPGTRRSVALRLALAPTMDSLRGALLAAGSNPMQLMAMLTVSIATYLLLMVIPEPTSKLLASVITVYLTAYLGADTVISLVTAWLRLCDEAQEASTFGELHAAGEHFGKVLGENGARVLIMTFVAVLGHTANLFIRGLPGMQQASRSLKAGSGGMDMAALVGRVQEAVVTGRGVTLVLAPAAVVASPVAMSGSGDIHGHHISTNKNDVSGVRGGPWTPRFQKIFAKAGMSLDDAENIVNVKGHQGPHPEEYHQVVHDRLEEATEACPNMLECRNALVGMLRKLAEEIATPGTRLNKLVTRTEG